MVDHRCHRCCPSTSGCTCHKNESSSLPSHLHCRLRKSKHLRCRDLLCEQTDRHCTRSTLPEQIHADTLIENRAGKFNLSIFFECFLLFFVQQFLYEFLHGKRHVPFLCHIHKPSIYPEQQLLFRHIMDIGSSFFSCLF